VFKSKTRIILQTFGVEFHGYKNVCVSEDYGSFPIDPHYEQSIVFSAAGDPTPELWFAIRVKSQYEKVTAVVLHDKDYEEFASILPEHVPNRITGFRGEYSQLN